MYQPLAPCPACHRHVRIAEAHCPFCAGELPRDLARAVVPGTGARLSRAAIAVFATTFAAAGCSGGSDTSVSSPPSNGASSSGGTVSDPGGAMTIYGGPAEPSDDAGVPPAMAPPGSPPGDNGASESIDGAPPRRSGG